jgi:CubicO group peptidase (beta-lactamase class C family)
MRHKVFFLSLLLTGILSCKRVVQSEDYSGDVLAKISLAENNLVPWVDTGDSLKWNLAERMAHYRVNGLAIGVINNFRTEWVRYYGYADISEQRKVDSRTLFQAASVSKSLNAAAILRLVSEGKADTTADINTMLKGWRLEYEMGKDKKPVTLVSLMSHTSGLSLFGYQGYPRGSAIPGLTEILNGDYNTTTGPPQQIFYPGERFFYSSAGIMVTQKALGDLSGIPYEKLMKREVLRPLGMSNSYYSQPPGPGLSKRMATGYDRKGDEIPGKYFVYPELAAVGLLTTAGDLCKYVEETCTAYNGITEKVLGKEMTRKRLEPVKGESGLGFFITERGGEKWFWHNGGSKGFTCIITGNAIAGQGAVIMLNSENGEILDEILASVATVYGWEGYLNRPRMNVLKRSVDALEKYCGEYDSGSEVMKIRLHKGTTVIGNSDYERELYFETDSASFIKEQKTDIRFRIRDDQVNAMYLNGKVFIKLKGQ